GRRTVKVVRLADVKAGFGWQKIAGAWHISVRYSKPKGIAAEHYDTQDARRHRTSHCVSIAKYA
ncbi:MAG: hypothetical protein ACKPKO_62695, partial [Candidatus Fonsibacter sp.]